MVMVTCINVLIVPIGCGGNTSEVNDRFTCGAKPAPENCTVCGG